MFASGMTLKTNINFLHLRVFSFERRIETDRASVYFVLVPLRYSQGDQLQLNGPIGLIGVEVAIGKFRPERNFEGVVTVAEEAEIRRFFVEGSVECVRNLSILYFLHYYYKFN